MRYQHLKKNRKPAPGRVVSDISTLKGELDRYNRIEVQGKRSPNIWGVFGDRCQGTGLGRGIIGGLTISRRGNIEEWSVVCEAARMEAFNRLVQHAHEIGADAIIGMRYDATEFSQGATEVLAYGTAVKLG